MSWKFDSLGVEKLSTGNLKEANKLVLLILMSEHSLNSCVIAAPETSLIRIDFSVLDSFFAIPEHCQLNLEGSYYMKSSVI